VEKLLGHLREVIGGAKTKIYLSEVRPHSATDRQIGSKFGNQAKPLNYSEKSSISYQFRADVQKDTSIRSRQRMMCSLKNTRLLPDGCYCLNDMGNKILFRINISPPLTTIAALDGADLWLGFPGHRTSPQWTSSYGAITSPDLHVVS
jgi:hypothetical protein